MVCTVLRAFVTTPAVCAPWEMISVIGCAALGVDSRSKHGTRRSADSLSTYPLRGSFQLPFTKTVTQLVRSLLDGYNPASTISGSGKLTRSLLAALHAYYIDKVVKEVTCSSHGGRWKEPRRVGGKSVAGWEERVHAARVRMQKVMHWNVGVGVSNSD
jgi:hypothetical protein